LLVSQTENVSGEVGKLAFVRGIVGMGCSGSMLSHDRVGAMAIFLSGFIEARYVAISLLLLPVGNEMTIGTEPRS
jgi:hypothetical protein